MSAKLFKESDSWSDSSGNSGEVTWSFKKNQNVSNKKDKKAKKRNHSATEDFDPNAGKYVRAPKFYSLEDTDVIQDVSPRKKKRNKLKRKLEAESSDEITPEKKLKKAPEERPSSFADQLRENLKGSRFRFLNEQMYKQTGEESMKIFREDETAFRAYHEGYRHQVEQWPMNPLDRIIKNMKKL